MTTAADGRRAGDRRTQDGSAAPDRRRQPCRAAAADPARVAASVAALGSPDDSVDVRETHISWVFLTADRAFKLKKPLVLDFLDYGTAQRRRMMCHEEIRLNRRLAPSLYVAVRAIVDSGGRWRITDEGDPAALDYLVEMHRYDENQTLATAAARGRVAAARLADLGELLAAFHRGCPPYHDRSGSLTVRHELEDNLRELADLVSAWDARERVQALARFLAAFVAGHAGLLDARGDAGAIREGHGDLRAEHVILGPTLSIVDCVEFDRGLRTADVADDLAFLVMDLCALGQESLLRRLIDEYRGAGGDCGPDELVWFFAVHRALVRAKVELLRAGQTGGERAGRHEAVADRMLGVAEKCAWRARGRFATVVCGVPASGKTSLAEALSSSSGVPVISSDVVRKQLAGVAARDRAPRAAYSLEFSRRTYRELGRRAAQAVGGRSGTLIDATFRRRADRVAFADGFGRAGPVRFVECIAPSGVLAERARVRDREAHRVSDATAEIVAAEQHRFDPLDEIGPGAHLVLRTDRALPAVIADLLALLDVRLTHEG